MAIPKNSSSSKPSTFVVYRICVKCNGAYQRDLSAMLGDRDFLSILYDYLGTATKGVSSDSSVGEMFTSTDVCRDGRDITGRILTGYYGSTSRIYRLNEGPVFEKQIDDADLQQKFFRLFVPKGGNTAFAVLEKIGNYGITRVFQVYFKAYLAENHPGLTIEFEPITPPSYLKKIMDGGLIKSVQFVRFGPRGDDVNQLEEAGISGNLGSFIITLKPEMHNVFDAKKLMARLSQGDRSGPHLLAQKLGISHVDKTLITLEVDGKQRTLELEDLSIGRPAYVEFLERDMEDGHVPLKVMKEYTHSLLSDIMSELDVP